MRYLTLEQREGLQRELDQRAQVLRGEIGAALSATEGGAHLANHYEEVDDQAIADLEGALDVAALERDIRELRDVRDALQRIHTGDYGLCASCGVDIPFSRLHAMPTALRCVPCETTQEFASGKVARNTL
jgi:DnaK suppressor protein